MRLQATLDARSRTGMPPLRQAELERRPQPRLARCEARESLALETDIAIRVELERGEVSRDHALGPGFARVCRLALGIDVGVQPRELRKRMMRIRADTAAGCGYQRRSPSDDETGE